MPKSTAYYIHGGFEWHYRLTYSANTGPNYLSKTIYVFYPYIMPLHVNFGQTTPFINKGYMKNPASIPTVQLIIVQSSPSHQAVY